MYCSNRKFITIATATGVDHSSLHTSLQTVLAMMQRWGSLVKSSKFQNLLEKESIETAKMMKLLMQINKLDVPSLKSLITMLASSKDVSFAVSGTDHIDAISEKLTKQFGEVEVTTTEVSSPSLQVAGNGRWYKRSLEKDIDKMMRD